jgi:hypothetical protein
MGNVIMIGIIPNLTPPGIPSYAINMKVVGNEYSATISWTNPTESSFANAVVVQKVGSAPTSLTDGTTIYTGTGTSVSVSDLTMDTTYYWAVFAVGTNGRHDDYFPTGSYTTPIAPAVLTNLTVVGIKYAASISWKNPTDKNFTTAVIVQKVGSAPTSINDGTEIYRGTGTSVSVSGLDVNKSYYWAAFSLGSNGKYRPNFPTGSYATPDLPSYVTNFAVAGNKYTANITWTNPTSTTYYQTVIVQKVGSVPTSISDGTEIYRGTGTSKSVSGLALNTTYYWAAFTLDEEGRYRTGVPNKGYTTPDLPNHVSNFKVSGNGYNATVSWTNPTSVTYYRTIIVQKVGSAPTSITDGTVVYNGTGTSIAVSTPANITTYCWAAFTIDEQNRHRSGFPTTSYTPLVEPTAYNLKQTYTGAGSKTYTAPTAGWYMVELIGGAGGSGATYWNLNGDFERMSGTTHFPSSYTPSTVHVLTGGGGGGAAYSCSKGIFLNKGDTIAYNVASLNRNATVDFNTTTVSYSQMKCTAGTYGDAPYKITSWRPGLAGSGGKASGGNYANVNGSGGSKGSENTSYKLTDTDQILPASGGSAGGGGGYKGKDSAGIKTVWNGSTYGGSAYNSDYGDVIANEERYGFCRIYAGNTNPS